MHESQSINHAPHGKIETRKIEKLKTRKLSEERLGMFFHCFPNNSVQGLHMHLVDLGATGPTFDHFSYKNLPATAVLNVLRDELAQATA